MIFDNIKNIKICNKESWKEKVYITLDIDWCSDEVLNFTLDIIKKKNIKATFFVTHETKLLERMRENKNIELGIHPNFNPLLKGDFRYGINSDEVIGFYKNIVPEALSVRSHSMTQNSIILDLFAKHGLRYDCNTFVPFSSGVELKPWEHWDKKLVKVPYFWEDDIHCLYNSKWDHKKYLEYGGIKVFDFHPVHIFLNTEDLRRYDNARESFNNYEKLKGHVNNNCYGTRDFFNDLILQIKK